MAIKPVSDYSLKNLNTFGLDIKASHYAAFRDESELRALLEWNRSSKLPLLILGGGSNILFRSDFDGLVLKNEISGTKIIYSDDDYALVKVGAGVIWNDFVRWAIDENLGGVENLSLIPGTVGAAPIQNIGAYGVELKDVFVELEGVYVADNSLMKLGANECEFNYRDSVFKRSLKGKLVITYVTFRLHKKHTLNIRYGAIAQQLQYLGITNPGIADVGNAVSAIRRSKLPDPAVIGNAGSFFKNPEVSEEKYHTIRNAFPDIVAYPSGVDKYKIAAGWLIEQCGWKGKVVGNTGSHKDQALVLVNYGAATGNEIIDLSENIRRSVFERFGVEIEPEVNII